MGTKYTSLTKIDLSIIEKIISHCGNVTDSICIYDALYKEYSKAEVKNKITKLNKAGWLIRIKKGIYVITNVDSHNFVNISPMIISNIFVPDSYVSFEYALNYYGLFDQLTRKITAITSLKSRNFTFQDLDFQFVKTKPHLIFGYKEIAINGLKAKVAELEKVILDYLYFRADAYSIDLVLEKLRENKSDFNFHKIQEYALTSSVSVKRRLGFLLDLIGVDTSKLHQEVKKQYGYSRLTKKSKEFNSKWRLYYEIRFAQ